MSPRVPLPRPSAGSDTSSDDLLADIDRMHSDHLAKMQKMLSSFDHLISVPAEQGASSRGQSNMNDMWMEVLQAQHDRLATEEGQRAADTYADMPAAFSPSDGGRFDPAHRFDIDPDSALSTERWLLGAMAEEALRGKVVVGQGECAAKLEALEVPRHVQQIGPNFTAPHLQHLGFHKWLSSYDFGSDPRDPVTVTQWSDLQAFGEHVHLPRLQQLDLSDQKNLSEIGDHFKAESLTLLSLAGTALETLPPHLETPALVTLDLKNLPGLELPSSEFWQHLGDIQSVEVAGTFTDYENDLPLSIQQNLAIDVDIRPENLNDQALDAAQNAARESVKESTRAHVAKSVDEAQPLDVVAELKDFLGYITRKHDSEHRPTPQGLAQWLHTPPSVLWRHLQDANTPQSHKDYFKSSVNAAFRAVRFGPNSFPHFNHIVDILDPNGESVRQISLHEFLAAEWKLCKHAANLLPGVSVDDAQRKFITILHQIQRGYNLQEDNDQRVVDIERLDDGHPLDKIRCADGAVVTIANGVSEIRAGVDIVHVSGLLINFKARQLVVARLREKMEAKALRLDDFQHSYGDDFYPGSFYCGPALRSALETGLVAELQEEFHHPYASNQSIQRIDQQITEQLENIFSEWNFRDTLFKDATVRIQQAVADGLKSGTLIPAAFQTSEAGHVLLKARPAQELHDLLWLGLADQAEKSDLYLNSSASARGEFKTHFSEVVQDHLKETDFGAVLRSAGVERQGG